MTEGEVIALIEKVAQDYALATIGVVYDPSQMSYQVGIRQGTHHGLLMAVKVIKQALSEKADKEKKL